MMHPPPPRPRPAANVRPAGAGALAIILAAGGLGSGCATPLFDNPDTDLRRAVRESSARELAEAQGHPQPLQTRRTNRTESLGLNPDILRELEGTSGPAAYSQLPTAVSPDLLGRPQTGMTISLERVILTSVRNNLAVQFARLAPAIDEARLAQAEAAFDWSLFSSLQWTSTDEQTVDSFSPGVNRRRDLASAIGVRKRLVTGGSFSMQQQYTYSDNDAPGSFGVPDPANVAQLTLQVDQPLLRNFGSDVALGEVRLATNAERDSIQELKAALLTTVRDGEEAYWSLVRTTGELQISQRLLNLGVEVRNVLRTRQESRVDVKPSQYSDAVATVESRRADVIRAENAHRQTSDRLKQLMNDPAFTVGSEIMLLPVDKPIDAVMSYSLLEVMATAIANRPEVQRALLAVDDASIRQMLADNARLPELNLRAQTRFNGLGARADNAFASMTDDNFVSFLVGLQLDAPIGNRAAEAQFRRFRLERMQTVIAYRDVLTRILLEVKANLRNVTAAYALIEQTRAARIAAAENLRTLAVEERTTGGLTPEFLDLKLRRQQSLGQAEVQELAAVTDYNIAIARLYASMGTALERNRIKFVVPNSREESLTPPAGLIDGEPRAAPQPAP